MRRFGWCAVVAAALSGCPQKGGASSGAAPAPATDEQKALYALGASIGKNLESFDLSAEEVAMVRSGLDAKLRGDALAVDLQQMGPKVNDFARGRQMKHMQQESAKEKEKGKAYVEKAKAEAGAEATASGLVYKSLTEGTGAQPAASDTVKVNYRGTLVDGTEFDSSFKRNAPATFRLDGVIRCWTEGVQKMKVGGKAKLVCPSDLAYGERGPPGIPGGATLTFEVELLEVLPPPTPPLPPGAAPAPPPGGAAKK